MSTTPMSMTLLLLVIIRRRETAGSTGQLKLIRGAGAMLVPPTSTVKNECTNVTGDGSNSGVCVGDVTFAKLDGEHQPV